jgi:uracil-DNA glycosylase
MPRPLLIGQAPSRSCGTPWASDAGRRLARYMGTTHEDLLELFDARNLNACHTGTVGKYDRFDIAEARETAAHMRRYVLPRRRLVVLCGMKVADCFGVAAPGHGLLVGRCQFVAVPHPAGTNMWWNDPGNREVGHRLLRAAWEEATRG